MKKMYNSLSDLGDLKNETMGISELIPKSSYNTIGVDARKIDYSENTMEDIAEVGVYSCFTGEKKNRFSVEELSNMKIYSHVPGGEIKGSSYEPMLECKRAINDLMTDRILKEYSTYLKVGEAVQDKLVSFYDSLISKKEQPLVTSNLEKTVSDEVEAKAVPEMTRVLESPMEDVYAERAQATNNNTTQDDYVAPAEEAEVQAEPTGRSIDDFVLESPKFDQRAFSELPKIGLRDYFKFNLGVEKFYGIERKIERNKKKFSVEDLSTLSEVGIKESDKRKVVANNYMKTFQDYSKAFDSGLRQFHAEAGESRFELFLMKEDLRDMLEDNSQDRERVSELKRSIKDKKKDVLGNSFNYNKFSFKKNLADIGIENSEMLSQKLDWTKDKFGKLVD